jgi:hypothetical protein
MICICRTCKKEYDEFKARGDYTGFCSAKCQHEKAKQLGYRKGQKKSEYYVLDQANCVGSIPVEKERIKLLKELEQHPRGSKSRIARIKRILNNKICF